MQIQKNNFFNATACKLLNSKTESQQHLQKLIDNINLFLVHVVSYDDIKRQWKVFGMIAQQDTTPLPAMLKLIVDEIIYPVSHIHSESIKKSVFPEQWKISKINPIPKTTNTIQLCDVITD